MLPPFLNFYLGVAILIMVAAIVIAKMGGRMIKQPSLEAWANVEMSQLVVNVFIIFFVIGFYAVFGTFSALYISSVTNINFTYLDMFEFVISYLDHLIMEVLDVWFILAKWSHDLEMYDSVVFKYGPGALNWKLATFKGVALYSPALNSLAYMVMIAFSSLTAQKYGLVFAVAISSNILLPLGLVFRIFPFFRNIGNEMIAIAISFGVIMPMIYFFLYFAFWEVEQLRNFKGLGSYLFHAVLTEITQSQQPLHSENPLEKVEGNIFTKIMETLLAPGTSAIVDWILNRILNWVTKNIPKMIGLTISQSLIHFSPFLYMSLLPAMFRILMIVSEVMFLAIIIPTFVLTFTIASTRAVAAVLSLSITGLSEVL